MLRVVIMCLFTINNLFNFCSSVNMLGPANMIYHSFEVCEPAGPEFSVRMVQKKFNRTTNVLDITLTTSWPLDDRVELEVKNSVKKEGGYKPGSFFMKDTLCSVLKTMLGDVFQLFLEIAGVEDCPLGEGTYEMPEFYFDNAKFTVPQLYGEYKMETFIYRDGELKACYVVYIDMVPKE